VYKLKRILYLVCFILCGTSCNLAPKERQHLPFPIPDHYQESGKWLEFRPRLQMGNKQQWWLLFQDDCLSHLEEQLSTYNFNIQLAMARYHESLAMLQISRSKLYPTIMASNFLNRQKNSSTLNEAVPPYLYTNVLLGAFLNYEVDAWASVRNTVAASKHLAKASRYDLAAIDLNLHTLLAKLYFQLQALNAEQTLLNRIVACYEHQLRLFHHLHQDGAVSALEEDIAQKKVDIAKTHATQLKIKRAKIRHAIAVLLGQNPSHFKFEPSMYPFKYVKIAPRLPSELLMQRPDLAAASERVKSANATIGVARAAFLPNIQISTFVGYMANTYNNLFSAPNLVWSIGRRSTVGADLSPPMINQVVFDGFNLLGQLKHSKATYNETVNQYRQATLKAFKEVEDHLVSIHRLEQEDESLASAKNFAKNAFWQAQQRMEIGIYTYIDVVNYEIELINLEIGLIEIRLARQTETVGLIDALGGGWNRLCVHCKKAALPTHAGNAN
jgi:NodT family efflux transporter outer membrane factor (OMF) lipoprotein